MSINSSDLLTNVTSFVEIYLMISFIDYQQFILCSAGLVEKISVQMKTVKINYQRKGKNMCLLCKIILGVRQIDVYVCILCATGRKYNILTD